MPDFTPMNVFNGDLYGATALMQSFERAAFIPTLVSDLGIFEPVGSIVDTFPIEYRNQTLTIALPVASRNSKPHGGQALPKGKSVPFTTIPFKETEEVSANSVFGVRDFGTQNLKTLEGERDYRTGLLNERLVFARELSRVTSAVLGRVLDGNGVEHCNFWTSFGLTDPGYVSFDPYVSGAAAGESGAVRQFFTAVIRKMNLTLGRGSLSYKRIAICGDTFFDRLVASAEVRTTYQYAMQADQLRLAVGGGLSAGTDTSGVRTPGTSGNTFNYAGITFVEYDGVLPNGQPLIGDDDCYVVPYGIPGLAVEVMAPPSWPGLLGSVGEPVHLFAYPTDTSGMSTTILAESHYLPVYTRPEAVLKITAATTGDQVSGLGADAVGTSNAIGGQ